MPLTVVSAPAGYGKSTLVSEWLALQKCRSAWLSLDAAESELGTFLNYLLTAVETIAADACSQTRALLAAPELPSAATLAAYLVNDLDRLDEPFLLVLDDYHSLRRSSSVHGLVEAMLEHAPRALHLVLISRNELPWSLTSLRAKGRVSEPWFRELCFTTAEATEFLAAAGCAIDHGVVDKLDAQNRRMAGGLAAIAASTSPLERPCNRSRRVDRDATGHSSVFGRRGVGAASA